MEVTATKKWLIYFCFFLSGVAGLMYEIIWTRFFSLTFGATTYSITTVLTSFMAGLALGSYLFGKIADRVNQRLMLYGCIELIVGFYALLFPVLNHLSTSFYLDVIRTFALDPVEKLGLKFVLSFLIMLIPTTLMGGSLPVLSRMFIKDLKGVSSKLGSLYAINTFGAVVGTYLVGFHLIVSVGLNASILIAAAINIGIGIIVILKAKNSGKTGLGRDELAISAATVVLTRQERRVIVFAVSAFMVSGFVSLSHEVVWTRILSLIIGSSTYAFTMILIGFLLGIALGSYLISHAHLIPRKRVNLIMFSLIEISIGFSAYALIPLFSKLPYIMLKAFHINPDSYNFITVYQFFLVLLIVIIPTTLMGATLPVIANIVSKEVRSVGKSIGNIYFFNTFGAIFGSFFAGFFFIPHLGTLNTLKLGISINIMLGIGGLLLAAHQYKRRGALLVVLVIAGGGFTGLWFSKWDDRLMDSGVSIYGPNFAKTNDKNGGLKDGSRLLYFSEGINATITVRKSENEIHLKTNGKADASTSRADMTTQSLLGYLPMMLHPNPRDVLVIGLASGITAGTVAQYKTIRSLDIAEIEPSMIKAANIFREANHHLLSSSNVKIIINDGRNYLQETNKTYDIIISEPSNPWISGIGSLYTADFFGIVKARLKPGGILCQWMHCYSMSIANLKMILKTVALSFEDTQLWISNAGDLLVLASDKKINMALSRIDQVMNYSTQSKTDFRQYLMAEKAGEIPGRLFLDKPGILAFTRGARINSDNHPYLEYLAPKDLYRAEAGKIYQALYTMSETLVPVPLQDLNSSTYRALTYYHRSKVYTHMNWLDKGRMYASKAISLDEHMAPFHFQMAEILYREKQYGKALRAVTRGLSLEKTPSGVRIHVNILLASGKHYEALSVLRQNKGLLNNYEWRYADILYAKRQFRRTIPFLEAALRKKQSAKYIILERLGHCYQMLGKLDIAEQFYVQSIKINEMNPRSQNLLAELYFVRGKYKEAIKVLSFIMEYWPVNSRARLRLTECYAKLNQG